MINYSVQSRGQLFVKGYAFLSFTKKVSQNSGKNITKNLSGKYSQKPLGHAKQSATDTLETISKRVLQKKTAEATAISWVIKSPMKLQKSQKIRHRIIQKQLKMSMIKKYQKKILSLEERKKIINDLRLI